MVTSAKTKDADRLIRLASTAGAEGIAAAQAAKGEDPFGYRAEFIGLVRLSRTAAAMEPQGRQWQPSHPGPVAIGEWRQLTQTITAFSAIHRQAAPSR